MPKQGSRKGGARIRSGATLTRRTFIAATGATTLGVGIELAAQSPAKVPALFVKAGARLELRRGAELLWSIDSRCFDTSGGGKAKVEQSGRRLLLEGFLDGTNIKLKLQFDLAGETLSIKSENGGVQSSTVSDWTGGSSALGIQFQFKTNANAAFNLSRPGSAFAATLTRPFNFKVEGPFRYEGNATGNGNAARLAFEAMTKNANVDTEINQLLKNARPLSRLTLEDVGSNDPALGWKLGSVGGRVLRLFLPGNGTIVLDRVDHAEGSHVLRRGGKSVGRSGARIRFGVPDYGRDIHVEAAELFEVLGGRRKRTGLKIERSKLPAYIEAERFSAAIKISRDCYFPDFDGQSQIEFPIEIFVVHVRGVDESRFEVDYRAVDWNESGLAVGQRGLNRSAPIWNTEGLTGLAGHLTLGLRGAGTRENRIHLGQDDSARLWLHRDGDTGLRVDSPILRARRSVDALDVGFIFYNFRLELGETSRLVALADAQRGVRFNPQHFEEECFSEPERWYSGFVALFSTTALKPYSRRPFRSDKDSVSFPGGPPTLIARTQASGASRIIFKPEQAGSWPLDANQLTDWRHLTLVVPPRALGEMPVEAQLAKIGIAKTTSREEAKKLIGQSLVQPFSDETALELVTGLFYAPEATARFRTTVPDGGRPALWAADLITSPQADIFDPNQQDFEPPKNTAAVRAIWATGLDPSLLFGKSCAPLTINAFPTSTSRQDRSEIAAQSSVFGLAALRAVTRQGVDVPNSRVRRVSKDWEFIDQNPAPPGAGDGGGPTIVQEGAFSPAPLKEFNARLTGFGADLDAEWQAEPIAPYFSKTKKDPFFERAFAVERHLHRTRLGSDVLAQVVYKGFLFPYGFRVSLIKITQREPFALPEYGAMMPLITRFYLIPKPIEKAYPGIYQPFFGREIPLASALLLGERSPELDGNAMLPPETMKLPDLTAVGPDGTICPRPPDEEPPPRVFWPMLKAGGRLHFDFAADGQLTRRTLPMLFVSNTDANLPGSVREIIRYYNSLPDLDRHEDHHGALTIFAPPRSPEAKATGRIGGQGGDPVNEIGSTTFETDHIIVAARPRLLPAALNGGTVDPDAPYTFDAFMNGADEPPFYPVMTEASIVIPALDRLMGSPQGLKRVGYNKNYILNGFDPSKNRGELYLNFLEDGVMDLGDNGKVSGGVARTPTRIAGISRINSIVGAAPAKSSAMRALSGGDPPIGSDDAAPWNYDAIAKNEFRPAEFFGGAKLLGIVDLGDIVKIADIGAQPLLKEVQDYALGDSGALGIMKIAATRVAALIRKALKDADTNLNRMFDLGDGPRPPDVSIERFYPALYAELTGFALLLETPPVDADATAMGWATELVAQWRKVKVSVDGVIANPSPEPLRAGMAEVRQFVDALQGNLGDILRGEIEKALLEFVDDALDKLAATIAAACFDASGALTSSWYFEAFAGALPAAEDTPAILKDKLLTIFTAEAMPADAARAAMSDALTIPLLTMMSSARGIVSNISSMEGAALAAAARAAASLLHDAAKMMTAIDLLLASARAHASTLCVAAGGTLKLEQLCALALEIVPPAADLSASLSVIGKAWPTLDLMGLPDTPAVGAARQAGARLRNSVNDLGTAIGTLDAVRDAISALDLDEICKGQPHQIATLIARVAAARDTVYPALLACVDTARELGQCYEVLPQNSISDALAALKSVRSTLLKLAADVTWARLADLDQQLAWLDAVPVVGTRIKTAKAEAIAAAAALKSEVSNAAGATIEEFASVAIHSQQLAPLEKNLLSLASDFSALNTDLVAQVTIVRSALLEKIADPLITVHETALSLADQAVTVFNNAPDLVKLFTQQVYTRLVAARDQIKLDLDVIRTMSAATGTPAYDALMQRWQAGNFGLAQAVELIVDFFNAIMTGQIGGIFDLKAVRDAAEDLIRQLIPTKVRLSYDWTGDLKSHELFEPLEDRKLTLSTHIAVDLLNPADRTTIVEGKVSKFALHLFGKPDLVTINFGETTFHFDGNVPKFETSIESAKPGKDLQYFETLSKLFGGESRIYVEPLGALEGLKVGYRYAADYLELGGVQITNFAFDTSLSLYFDRRPAIAYFAVSSREAPCGIIVAPAYYGAGFISLTTTAKKILAFEIQLEFGAARVINFGPLKARGSVSAGIYLMRATSAHATTTRLEGFVHAVGEGNIACFGVSVNFAVKVLHDGGKVTGSATYRFTFRVGFAKVGYGVTASYNFAGNSKSARAASPRRKAALSAPGCPPIPDKTKQWLCYRDNFVAGWPG